MTAFPHTKKPFRILSLDGGGIRGAFEASCLAEMERHLAEPIGSYFDLIAGTSTGGIIAIALGLGESAATIESFYRDRGPAIFARKPPLLKRVPALSRPKYSQRPLRDALNDIFGDRVLEDSRSRLVIPSVDMTSGKTVVFKTPHQPNFIRDRKIAAVDVALATGAAPTYFPQSVIGPGSAYVDGGLWANNPSMVAYAEAVKIIEVCRRESDPIFTLDDVLILSLGTGKPSYFAKPPSKGAGLAWWGQHFLTVVTVSQAQGVEAQTQYVLGHRYKRINFDISGKAWGLDATNMLDELIHLGKQKATEYFPQIKDSFLSDPAERYTPF